MLPDDMQRIAKVEQRTITNSETGEIVQTERTELLPVLKTPDFVMCFTADITYLQNINGGAAKILFGLLTLVDRNNEITLNKARKDEISHKIGIKPSSFGPLLSQLVKAEVVIKRENAQGIYILNPNFFGKGRFRDIKKLRMLIEYDFQESTKRVAYEQEFLERNPDDIVERFMANKDEILEYLDRKENGLLHFTPQES